MAYVFAYVHTHMVCSLYIVGTNQFIQLGICMPLRVCNQVSVSLFGVSRVRRELGELDTRPENNATHADIM